MAQCHLTVDTEVSNLIFEADQACVCEQGSLKIHLLSILLKHQSAQWFNQKFSTDYAYVLDFADFTDSVNRKLA